MPCSNTAAFSSALSLSCRKRRQTPLYRCCLDDRGIGFGSVGKRVEYGVQLLHGMNVQPGNETIFTGYLVAFSELGCGLKTLLDGMHLARQRPYTNDGLQRVAKSLRVDIDRVSRKNVTIL